MKTILGMLALLVGLNAALGQVQSNSAARDPAKAAAFRKTHPCPASGKIQRSCPGYVVDHIKPLCAGGADESSNMMWMTVEDGKKKDAVERELCQCLGTVK